MWVRRAAGENGRDPSTLGEEVLCDVMSSMASRQAFLSDRNHRIRFVGFC